MKTAAIPSVTVIVEGLALINVRPPADQVVQMDVQEVAKQSVILDVILYAGLIVETLVLLLVVPTALRTVTMIAEIAVNQNVKALVDLSAK